MATRAEREAEARAQAHRETAERLLQVPGLAIEDVDLLTAALSRLTFRERHILYLREGIPNGETYTLEQVGRVFRVTKERIRQIQWRAMRRIEAQPGGGAAWKRLERALPDDPDASLRGR